MGNFGDTIQSLVDTYSNCLALLKALRGGDQRGDERRSNSLQSSLGSQIRSDRARIRNAYSSRLSRRGASFERGDAPARSSLRRVIEKLRAALSRVAGSIARDKDRQSTVDYRSLMALSSASRLDALRTMTDLSARLRSRSRVRRSTGSSRSGGQRRTGSSATSATSSKRNSRRSHGHQRRSGASQTSSSSSSSPKGRNKRSGAGQTCSSKERNPRAGGRRTSMATISSESTKLGEITRRSPGGDRIPRAVDYAAEATYPLHPRRPWAIEDTHKKKRRLWGLFGGR